MSELTKHGLLSQRTLLLGLTEMTEAFYLLPPEVLTTSLTPIKALTVGLGDLSDPNPHQQVLEMVELPRD